MAFAGSKPIRLTSMARSRRLMFGGKGVRTPKRTRPAAAQGDRWEQMHQAMVRCAREEFLTRFVCEQRVGRQYCEGYWGTVPQCPGAQQRDRGQ